MRAHTRDQVIRTVSWSEAVDFLTSRRVGRRGRVSAAGVCHATLGLVPYVPEPLRHIGCMWLEEGDESRRCNRPVSWTMGTTLEWPRLYCEEHAQRILARRRQKSGGLQQSTRDADPEWSEELEADEDLPARSGPAAF